MVNCGARETLPQRFGKGRNVYVHKSSVTLIRTKREEASRIGELISGGLRNHCQRPGIVEVVIPMGGLSILSKSEGVYADEEADECLWGC